MAPASTGRRVQPSIRSTRRRFSFVSEHQKLPNNSSDFLQNVFSALGVRAFLFPKTDKSDYVVINRNYLSRYYRHDDFVQLYEETMRATRSVSRNSFEKQIRYFGLYQMALHVLEREFFRC